MVSYSNVDDLSKNLAYLFQQLSRGISHLEQETYILQALYMPEKKFGYHMHQDSADEACVIRWPESRYPLKVYAGPDFGFLFSPVEVRQVTHWVQHALGAITAIDSDTFRFELIDQPHKADIVIKFRKTGEPGIIHCNPQVGANSEIQKAEIIANIVRGTGDPRREERLIWELTHNMLHALGIYGHSHESRDTACTDWLPELPLISPRDRKTLQLLYRCPISLTRKELLTLWNEYKQRFLASASNIALDAIVSEKDVKEALRNVQVIRQDLCPMEVALQELFRQQLAQIEAGQIHPQQQQGYSGAL